MDAIDRRLNAALDVARRRRKAPVRVREYLFKPIDSHCGIVTAKIKSTSRVVRASRLFKAARSDRPHQANVDALVSPGLVLVDADVVEASGLMPVGLAGDWAVERPLSQSRYAGRAFGQRLRLWMNEQLQGSQLTRSDAAAYAATYGGDSTAGRHCRKGLSAPVHRCNATPSKE